MTRVAAEHRLGPLDAIPVGEGRAYAVDGVQVAVFRMRSGALHATQALCPHRQGPLADGQLDERVVLCPLHAAVFELATGQSPSGHDPLTVYAVREQDGEVLLSLEEG